MTFKFLNKNKNGSLNVGNSGNGQNSNSLNYTNPNIHVKEVNVNYAREYSLRLDKIILIDSDRNSLIDESGVSNLGASFPNYVPNSTDSPNWASPIFGNHYGSNYSYGIHQEQSVLDIGDIPSQFVENNAIKVIQFNQSYELVKNTPSSMIDGATYGGNTQAARLTLNSVVDLGRGGTNFMPATGFEYYDSGTISNPNFQPLINDSKDNIQSQVEIRKTFVDPWGYMQGTYTRDNGELASKAELWSLKEITSPTGAKVSINYEEDEYWTEAFARRYWEDKLQFTFYNVNNLYCGQSGQIEIKIEKDPNLISSEEFNFGDYFQDNEQFWMDIWYSKMRNYPGPGYRRASIDILEQKANILSVSDDELYISVYGTVDHCKDGWEGVNNIFNTPIVKYDIGASQGQNKNRYNLAWMPETSSNDNAHSIVFKIIANKVPENETGGGLRVKEIVTKDLNNVYKSTYDYNHPTKNRSSGITSYAPVDGIKYVPYQSELPPPGVMYEYVTMSETDVNGNYNSKTRYRHHVLNPVFNIFNPEISLELLDSDGNFEDDLFWVNVSDNEGGLDGNNPKKVVAKKIDVHVNTALFGQIKSIEVLNSENHSINKVINEYANGRNISTSDSEKAYIKETFNSLKSVFLSNEDGTSVIADSTKRLLSISSRTEYKNLLKSTKTISGGNSFDVEYSNIDPWLGSFRTTESTLSDGSVLNTTKIPAYEKYSEMGSKILNPNSKNMLTQQAMSISTVDNNVINASVITWNKDWSYRDDYGYDSNPANEHPVWRKHKSFVWKDNINPVTGTYNTNVDENNSYFDWTTGIPASDNWQKASEVTRYTHWSLPIEGKDINGNFASSKLADDHTKVIATGNARYTEMYYSGAEYVASGNYFEGEVQGAKFTTNKVSHTGDYSVTNNKAGDKVFQVTGNVSSGFTDLSEDFRPGIYKVSFWAHEEKGFERLSLILNGTEQKLAETVDAGCWRQFNFYVELKESSKFELYVTNTFGNGFFFDDFRMHPIYASMSSYVYNQDTDELLYVLDANNMGMAYRYDEAGGLKASYREVETTTAFDGGFKLVQQYKQHYQNLPTSTTYNENINNCLNQIIIEPK